MDVTAVSAVSSSAAIDSNGAGSSNRPLPPKEMSSESDSQLMMLAAQGNTQAILELERRDAARAARLPPAKEPAATSANEALRATANVRQKDAPPPSAVVREDQTVPPVNAGAPRDVDLENRDAAAAERRQASAELATTLDAKTRLELEQHDAAQAARQLANADQQASATPKEEVGNIVDTFV